MARDAWSKDINVMIGGSSYEGLMMAFSLNVLNVSKPVDVLRNTNYFTPSYELGLNVNDDSCAKYGKILKQLYYGCTRPSKTNTEGALTVRVFCLICLHILLHYFFSTVRTFISGTGYKELYCHELMLVVMAKPICIALMHKRIIIIVKNGPNRKTLMVLHMAMI